MSLNNNISVILPVYADWDSLSQCLDSVIEHLDVRHTVYIVNDCGPEADDLEKKIIAKTKGKSNFKYHRNQNNIGFVKTCNKAVLELDNSENDIMLLNSDTIITENAIEEMIKVLNVSDRHGVVSPRSSNATIASVPLKLMNNEPDRLTEYAYKVYSSIKAQLPRYTVVPVCVGFAMLVRRDLIQNYGFLDEIYGLGYCEEVDFCMRVNKYGYSSILANKAFIYHLESRSFSSEKKKKLQEKNDAILLDRYPYYSRVVQDYFKYNVNPIDWFADPLASASEKKKILISLYHLPLAINGSVKNVLSFIACLKTQNNKNYDIVIMAQKPAIEFHGLRKFGFRVETPEDIDELFDVGYSPLQIFHFEHLALLNRYCLRYAISHLDIISLRNYDHFENDLSRDRIFIDSIKYADKVFTISEYSKSDLANYFIGHKDVDFSRVRVVPQGVSNDISKKINIDNVDPRLLEFVGKYQNKYTLIVGNHFPHKSINLTLKKLGSYDKPIIALGARGTSSENKLFFNSGSLTDDTIAYMYSKAGVVLFPSTYEGYGLPIAEAAYYNKPIVVKDNALSKEVVSLTGAKATYFKSYDSLTNILNSIGAASMSSHSPVRTLEDYSLDLFSLIQDLLHSKVDEDKLSARWAYFTSIEKYVYLNNKNSKTINAKIREKGIKILSKNKKTYNLAKKTYRKLKKR